MHFAVVYSFQWVIIKVAFSWTPWLSVNLVYDLVFTVSCPMYVVFSDFPGIFFLLVQMTRNKYHNIRSSQQLTTFHHEWDGIFYFVTKLDTNIQKSTFGKKVVALFYTIQVLYFMRWTTLVKIIIIIRRTFCFASEISNQLLSSVLVVVFQSSLLISSLIDLSSGLLF